MKTTTRRWLNHIIIIIIIRAIPQVIILILFLFLGDAFLLNIRL